MKRGRVRASRRYCSPEPAREQRGVPRSRAHPAALAPPAPPPHAPRALRPHACWHSSPHGSWVFLQGEGTWAPHRAAPPATQPLPGSCLRLARPALAALGVEVGLAAAAQRVLRVRAWGEGTRQDCSGHTGWHPEDWVTALTGPLDQPPRAELALAAGEFAAVLVQAAAEVARLAAADNIAGGRAVGQHGLESCGCGGEQGGTARHGTARRGALPAHRGGRTRSKHGTRCGCWAGRGRCRQNRRHSGCH